MKSYKAFSKFSCLVLAVLLIASISFNIFQWFNYTRLKPNYPFFDNILSQCRLEGVSIITHQYDKRRTSYLIGIPYCDLVNKILEAIACDDKSKSIEIAIIRKDKKSFSAIIDKLAAIPNLKSLSIQGYAETEDLELLSKKLPYLEELSFYAESLERKDIDSLKSLKHLKYLVIPYHISKKDPNNPVTEDYIKQTIPSLEHVKFEN